MSDLIERAREASTLKYQYHTIHVPTILERLAAELERLGEVNMALEQYAVQSQQQRDALQNALAELERLTKENAQLLSALQHIKSTDETLADNERLTRENAALRGFTQELADEPCSYGDNCPPFVKTNHGQCLHCKARTAIDSARAKESGVVDRLAVRACRCGLKHGITVSEVCNAHCPTVYGTYCARCGHDPACHAPKD